MRAVKTDSKAAGRFAFAFTAILLVLFLLMVNSEIHKLNVRSENIEAECYNALEEYPFEADVNMLSSNAHNVSTPKVSKLLGLVDKAENFIKLGVNDELPQRIHFVHIRKYVDRFIWGYSITTSVNGVSNQDNSGLTLVMEDGNGGLYSLDRDISIDQSFEKLATFAEEEIEEGRNVFILEIPINAYGEDRLTAYPDYYRDFSKHYTDSLLSVALL